MEKTSYKLHIDLIVDMDLVLKAISTERGLISD